MPSEPDREIPIALACEIVDVSRQVRATWIRRHLIAGSTAGTCSQPEIYELATFARLVEIFGFDEARIAWKQVRDQFRGAWEATALDIVVDMQIKTAVVSPIGMPLAEAVKHGRPVRVVAIAEHLRTVAEAFERVARGLDDD